MPQTCRPHVADTWRIPGGYLADTSRIGRGEVFTASNSHFNTSFAILGRHAGTRHKGRGTRNAEFHNLPGRWLGEKQITTEVLNKYEAY